MKVALTKADIAEHLVKSLGMGKNLSKEFTENFFDEIAAALVSGEPVRLSRFGNFELRDKTSRPGRNPKTKEEVMISARRVVTFKAGQKLKARVEGYQPPSATTSDEHQDAS